MKKLLPVALGAMLFWGCAVSTSEKPASRDASRAAENGGLPFIIVRNYGSGKRNFHYTKLLLEMQKKHPGLIDEIWFSGSSLDGLSEVQKKAEENLPFREECQQLGIRFSYQIGQTLNHGVDGKKRPHFPDDAWAVDCTGKQLTGVLCPLSLQAQNYARQSAKIILKTLHPESLWPDDDLRLSHKSAQMICFCDRCLGRFNQKFHHNLSREKLRKRLETDYDVEAAKIRREWAISNGENLAEFAAVYRQAVDQVDPRCRLGIQTVCASWVYDGPDFIPLLKALAGEQKVGIRPGALYYKDDEPRQMLFKMLDVQTESARCRKSGIVSHICYEAENWPHIAAEKNPYSQMTECAFALASGADSLALYWGTDIHRESDEINNFYFEALHEYKPFLLAVRDAFAGATPSGISLYRGAKRYEDPNWQDFRHPSEKILMENALPVTRIEAAPEAFYLDERAVRELAPEDLPTCFSRAVLMDVPSFEEVARKFPALQFVKKVKIQTAGIDSGDAFNAKTEQFERFPCDKLAMHLTKVILPQDRSVKTYSAVTGQKDGCGTCLIPTEYGGAVVLMQKTLWPNFWNGYRRQAVLDALDDAAGNLCVRLKTNGFSVNVLGSKDPDGKTVGAFLLNMGCGRTMPLEFAIRNPAFESYMLFLPGKTPIRLTPMRRSKKEIVFQLPQLEAWQSVLIAGEK